jgi:hypothetical protein
MIREYLIGPDGVVMWYCLLVEIVVHGRKIEYGQAIGVVVFKKKLIFIFLKYTMHIKL